MVTISTDPGLWIAAFLIIGYFTVFFGDNIWFQICQHTIVGAGVGHGLVWALVRITDYVIVPLQGPSPDYLLIVFSVVGLMAMLRLSRTYGWLGRYFTAFSTGIGLGLTTGTNITAMVLGQIKTTIKGVQVTGTYELFNAVVVLLSVILIGAYFLFTIKPQALGGTVGWAQKLGRYGLMITMGASATSFFVGCIAYTIAPMVIIVYNFLGI
jgi:hypothetical protein